MQTFQLCDLKMREILVIVIYKGGGGWRHTPLETEMSFTAFSKKINVFLRLQNIIKISNETPFTSAQRQLCVLFLSKKPLFFLLVHTQQHNMRKQKNYLRPINFFFLSAETNRSCNHCYSNFAALPYYTLHTNSCTFRVSVLNTLSRAWPAYTWTPYSILHNNIMNIRPHS